MDPKGQDSSSDDAKPVLEVSSPFSPKRMQKSPSCIFPSSPAAAPLARTTGGVLQGAAEGCSWRLSTGIPAGSPARALGTPVGFWFKRMPSVSICHMPTLQPSGVVLRFRGNLKYNSTQESLGITWLCRQVCLNSAPGWPWNPGGFIPPPWPGGLQLSPSSGVVVRIA